MVAMKELADIQRKLSAPKNQRNAFGNYNYRSCEDILEAVKPLLGNCVLTVSDEVVEVGGRIYVKASAVISNSEKDFVQCLGWAREPEDKKGMDQAQITGAASSYARKYALNGLFCIDDNKDADATNDHGKAPAKKATKKAAKTAPKKDDELATIQQVQNITILKKKAGVDDETFNKQLKHYGVDDVAMLSQENAGKLIAAYTKKLSK